MSFKVGENKAMNQISNYSKNITNLKDVNNFIEGLLAIAQGLLLVALSALTMFVVYVPLSLAVIAIFGIIGSICFFYGVETLRNYFR
jgi:type IV secretory pathway TrbL component